MQITNQAQRLTVSHAKIRSTQQSHIQILILISLLGIAPVTTQCWAAEEKAQNSQVASNSATTTNAAPSSSAAATAQESAAEQPKIEWQIGPQKEQVAEVASLTTLKGEGYLDPSNADKFLTMTGNLSTGSTNILVAEDDSWWATFDFDASGYVKDNEKIDADQLLKDLQAADDAQNERRQQLGLSKVYTVGWAVPPHYDAQTKQLEWAMKLRDDENNETINYTIRILGRTGVMSATLVSDEAALTQNIAAFKNTLKSFEFNEGEKYTQFQAGDKVAEYGLAALVAGGAAAVATKKGLWGLIAGFFAAAWKFIAIGFVAVGAWISSLFKRNKGE